MQETWAWSLRQEDPLEEEMATHSNILIWKIPWTESLVGYKCKEWLSTHGKEDPEELPLYKWYVHGILQAINDLMLSLLGSSSLRRIATPFSLGVYLCLASVLTKQFHSELLISSVSVFTVFAFLKHSCFQAGQEPGELCF